MRRGVWKRRMVLSSLTGIDRRLLITIYNEARIRNIKQLIMDFTSPLYNGIIPNILNFSSIQEITMLREHSSRVSESWQTQKTQSTNWNEPTRTRPRITNSPKKGISWIISRTIKSWRLKSVLPKHFVISSQTRPFASFIPGPMI